MNVGIVEWGGSYSVVISDYDGMPLNFGIEATREAAEQWADTTLELMCIHPALRAPDQHDRLTLLLTEPA